jgi:hypothetical protein
VLGGPETKMRKGQQVDAASVVHNVLVDVCEAEQVWCFAKEQAAAPWLRNEQDSEGFWAAIVRSGVQLVTPGCARVSNGGARGPVQDWCGHERTARGGAAAAGICSHGEESS